MSRRIHLSLWLVALLAACDQTGAPGTPSAARPKASPAAMGSPRVAGASARPSTPAAAGAEVLRAPTQAHTALHGRIAIDAAYAVAAGGATFISDQGGGLIQVPNALLANNGGNLISRDPAGIVSHNGAGLTSKVKLISDRGGGFISDQGGGLRAFGLRQAGGPEHRSVPAAGMIVGLLSLRDGAYLPIGVDSQGKAVYAIYTDARGEFVLNAPAGIKDNVLVTASFPGTRDTRLAVDLVTRPVAVEGGLVVDDSTTVITAYMRRAIVARLEEVTTPDPCSLEGAPADSFSKSSFQTVAGLLADPLDTDAFKRLPRASRLRVLTRYADAALAGMTDLEAVEIQPSLARGVRVSGPALPVLRAQLAEVERAAARRLAESPTYFDDRPYVTLMGRIHPNEPIVSIRKPADLSEFMVPAFMTSAAKGALQRMELLLLDLGLDTGAVEDLQAAAGSVFVNAAATLIDPDTVERMRGVLKAAIADEREAALPPDAPCAVPSPLPATATTVSTWGADGADGDGPALTTRFREPQRLLYDPAGFLIVSERHRVRRISLTDPAHPVVTIAGFRAADRIDGAGAAARFSRPEGLALDGKGSLFVADRGNHSIRRIAGYAGAEPVVSTLAGDGTPGFADAVGAAARFDGPTDVAHGPDGLLYVVDAGNRRIRRIAADGGVTTWAGTGLAGGLAGRGTAASFMQPRGIAFGAEGRLYLSDAFEGVIRVIGPDATVAQLAGNRYAPPACRAGTLYTARVDAPGGLAGGPRGELVVADTNNHRVRLIDPQGLVTTLAGGGGTGEGQGGLADGPTAASRLATPEGVAIAPDGTLYVADTGNNRIRIFKLP